MTAAARRLADSPQMQEWLASPGTAAFISDNDGNVLWASAACGKVLGHAPADLVGKNAWHLLVASGDLAAAATVDAMVRQGDVVTGARFMRADHSRDGFRVRVLNREGLRVVVSEREFNRAAHNWNATMA